MSEGRSRSSSRSSSGGRRRNAELRKYVLKKNHLESLQKDAVFQLTREQKIRLKRTVCLLDDKIAIFTTIYIYDSLLSPVQYDEALGTLKTVKEEKHYRENKDRNPMETISQTVYHGVKMMRLERTTTLAREYLDREWQTSETRGIEKGFVSRLADDKEVSTSIKTSSESSSTESAGYKNQTSLLFHFDHDDQTPDHLLKGQYRKREEWPDMEHCIHLDTRVEEGRNTVKMFLDVHLKPELYDLEKGSYVEEIREYRFNASESQIVDLDRKFKASPGLSSTLNKTAVFWSSKMTPPSVHPIAIPGPQSHRKVPRLKLPDSPEKDVQTAVLFSQKKKIQADVSLSVEEPKMTMEVSKVGDKSRKHSVTLAVEIGGEPYEFTGNIFYRGPKDFLPKRVLVDGNIVWQQSNDWNPASSVTRSQINMSLNDTK